MQVHIIALGIAQKW